MSRKLPPSVSSIGFLSSVAGGSGSRRILMAQTEAPAEVAAAAESIQNMKGSLGSFGVRLILSVALWIPTPIPNFFY